ncbi:DNA adenine methylase [Patescibacteria group bacterium]|nr:DNA adenine methylase [Patescibacteria group bacterium]
MRIFQDSLFSEDCSKNGIDFSSKYLSSHLITYLGNKRKLLPFLNNAIQEIKIELNKDSLVMLDGFAGSGVVSRMMKYHASKLISNDIESYTYTVNKAYLANFDKKNLERLQRSIEYLNKNKYRHTASDYFITHHYSPKNDHNIMPGERVFYTRANALAIDNIRYLIDSEIDPDLRIFCLANLIVKASIHNNTSGVFKGFHKKDGIGHFGGKGENALNRIKGEIILDVPIFSSRNCEVQVHQEDTNKLVTHLEKVDVAYFDPPYNQHPYGSNYFMLNIINEGKQVEIQDGVSGIVKEWNKSAYNKKKEAIEAMDELVKNTKAKYILISYNDEGIIPLPSFERILSQYGEWHVKEKDYNTYRGSRNLNNRNIKVKELLWVLKKH